MAWTNQTKNTASYTFDSINLDVVGNILMEESSNLLREDSDFLLLEGNSTQTTPWTNQTKN